MSAAGNPRIDHYDWAGGREAMLRFGPDHGPTVVVTLPLLEEANRTRALMVAVLRRLAARGIASALPELPGTGESLVATSDMRLADLREAFAAATAHVGDAKPVAIRSGALLAVTSAPNRGNVEGWMLSPQDGAEVVREWRRLQKTGGGDMVADNHVAPALWDELATATFPPGRTVRLDGDPRRADLVLPGPPPWRRAEPHGDPALAALLADDIVAWISRCAG